MTQLHLKKQIKNISFFRCRSQTTTKNSFLTLFYTDKAFLDGRKFSHRSREAYGFFAKWSNALAVVLPQTTFNEARAIFLINIIGLAAAAGEL